MLLRVSCLLRGNHQATAKSNGYNQRHRENRTRGAWRMVRGASCRKLSVAYNTSNLRQKLIKLEQCLVKFLLVSATWDKFISIVQGRHFWFTNYKIFLPQAQLHFLLTFLSDFACSTLRHVMVYFTFFSFKLQIYLLSSVACLKRSFLNEHMWSPYLNVNVLSHSPIYVCMVVGVDISSWYTILCSIRFPSMGQALEFQQLQFFMTSVCSGLFNSNLLWLDMIVLTLGMQL